MNCSHSAWVNIGHAAADSRNIKPLIYSNIVSPYSHHNDVLGLAVTGLVWRAVHPPQGHHCRQDGDWTLSMVTPRQPTVISQSVQLTLPVIAASPLSSNTTTVSISLSSLSIISS